MRYNLPIRLLPLPVWCAFAVFYPAIAANLPSGYSEGLIANGLSNPTAMEFAPDGRLFVCQQGGQLRVIKNGTLLATPFLTVNVASNGERGLLGIAFDPNFAVNRFVYVYYTATSPSVHNRVSRFTANGDTAVPGSEVVILDLNNLSSASNHNGGAIHFGSDGKLYIAVGENANTANAQSFANLLGKILRLNSDGTIPTDNPFYNTATGVNRAIWALGLRNPFTFAVQPGTGRMFINDVGQNTWEEINEAVAGANYGWPSCEGSCGNSAYRQPIFQYNHGSGSTAGFCIAGGAFYNPATVQFPSTNVGVYFFGEYVNGWIRRLDPANGNQVTGFATGINGLVDLKVGADGRLYYLARGSGAVYAISFNSSGQAPQITQQPVDQTVTVGQAATFSVMASGSPPLSYQWQRNNANISGATASSYTLSSTVAADNNAAFRCLVANSSGSVTSNPAILHVSSGGPPSGTISTPAIGTLYNAGDTILFSGTGTDPEDGTLPASAFSWTIVFHHDVHTHPFLGPINGVRNGSFVIPTEGETAANVWYRINLTVTDSTGRTHNSFRDVRPRTATMSLTTSPANLQVTLDGQPVTTPAMVTNVVGMRRTLGVVSPQTLGSTTYQFASWSDGGAATHTISARSTATTYTATYQVASPAPAITTASLPNGTVNVAYSATLAGSGGTTPYSWAVASGSMPGGLTLNPTSGLINGTPTSAGTFNFIVRLSDSSNPVRSVTKAFGIVVAASSSARLGNSNDGTLTDWIGSGWINAGRFQATANMTVGTMFAKVTAIPGRYKCAIYSDSGGQPSRLLRSSSEISNPSTGWQTFPLTSSLVLTSGQYYWLAIWSNDANARTYYSNTAGSVRWGFYNYGNWPDPLGTTSGGSFNYCIYAAGSGATLASIAVTPVNPSITAGTTQQFTATGTYSDGSTQNLTSQATWTSSSTAVATINSSGLATSSSAGTTTISATLSGRSGSSTLTVQPGLAITTASLPNGTVNVAYSATLAGSGGTAPYSWALAGGSLPGGLALNPSSGLINGTPTSAGTFNFTVRLSDSSNPIRSVTKAFGIVIAASTSARLGNSNDGTLTDWIGSGWINAGRFQAAANMTVGTMFAKVTAIPGRYKCAIYSDSGGQPSRLLRSSSEVSNPSAGWQTFPLTSSLSITNGQYYWLAIWSNDANARTYYSITAGSVRWGFYNYGNWPDPFATTSGGSFNYCIYAAGSGATLASMAATDERPAVLSVELKNGDFTISWDAIEERHYVLEYVNNLGDTNWTPLSPPIQATGPTVTVTNSSGSSHQRFYRVSVTH
jgi:glucose/arabinose dehydrogenase